MPALQTETETVSTACLHDVENIHVFIEIIINLIIPWIYIALFKVSIKVIIHSHTGDGGERHV